ncbi:MAG: type II toxin-antitoxin system RelE/ParE family toxin [Ignavibacteria bacterium]|nr:type II toxin-antitoxin system RelE/ParE family toxin [Ignavibacteria bacterium]
MAYKVLIKPSASKNLDALPDKEVKKILYHISQLKEEPRPVGVQKLTNVEGYRIRSGYYRILYEIDEKSKTVLIYRVKNRKDVYKK